MNDAGAAEIHQLEFLEGPGIAEPLRAALGTLGRDLDSWVLRQVHHRPGAGATGIYEVVSSTAGNSTTGFLCATTARIPDRHPSVVTLNGPDGLRLAVWNHPEDPLLPGFPWACDSQAVGQVLFAGQPTVVRTVSYRPLRRAVMVAESGGVTRYLKVLRNGNAEPMKRRHLLLTGAGVPAPRLVDVPGPEVVAMMPAAGTPLAELLLLNGAVGLAAGTLLDLLRRLPDGAMELPERLAWAVRVRDYANGAVAVLPDHSTRITDLAEGVHRLVNSTDAGPKVPSHGDFYEANLLVTGNEVTGLLDVDALGPGHLVDDLACFAAHVAVLPALDSRYIHVPAALERFMTAFDDHVDPAALRARAAGVVVTLIAGAKHSSHHRQGATWQADALQRLGIAEELFHSARGLAH